MLSKTYDPKSTETKHYQRWEEKGYFEASGKGDDNYTIMIPPPNVTGSLHVGHGLTMSLQDMLIRYNRMQGKNTLWQPGTDHAGIATQMVVERKLDAAGGPSRKEMGRDKFLEKVWEWKAESGGTITSQLRRLGASCAWSREDFTMNQDYNKAVNKVFVDLYNKGLIYKGTRLVNWDPVLQTAISDLEVEHKESNGHLWHFKYPLTDGSGHVVVATTRPETMFGDTAVAVNPEDERYKAIIGKTIKLPLVGREIPVVADDYVDAEFGSGVVKITPAHDFNDFEVGKRHDLEQINVMTKEACMNENAPASYVGLDRFEAREKVVKDFESLGLLEKIEDHVNNVGHGDRTGSVIEPFLTEQWYAKATELAKPALKAVQDGRTKFVPENWTKTYYNWMENIEDWCISRQLWWGHQIPAWYKDGEVFVGEEAPEGEGWTRDNDVLDTWFSSALWPFVTLGWPSNTAELKAHYPGNVLVTGHDIIFFWVARMMMMGLHFMDEVPFDTVYVHALVKDEHGQKMSKSKGNVIDPLTIIEDYGTDAFRFTMASLAAPGRDVKLAVSKIEGHRNFVTKIWNAARYAEMNEVQFDASFDPKTATHPVNRWIVGEMSRLISAVDKGFADYRFNDVANTIYDFVWNTYCSWYLELSKPLVYGDDAALVEETRKTMGAVLEAMLRVMHPVMPFVTEEIWQQLTQNNEESSIMLEEWPTTEEWTVDEAVKADIDWLVNVVSAIRAARSESNVPPKAEVEALVRGASAADLSRLEKYAPFFKSLANIVSVNEMDREMANTDVAAVAEGFEVILPLEGHVDFEAEKERVQKEVGKLEAELNKIQGMLGNENFVARAPEHVVKENTDRRDVIVADLSKLKAVLEARQL